MEVKSKFLCRNVNEKIRKVTWRIENFSSIKDKMLYSEDIIVDGNKWHLLIYPKGNDVDYLSIYLGVANSATLPSGWSAYVQIGFAVINQIDRRNSVTQALEKKWAEFEAKAEAAEKEEKTVEAEWGRLKDFISSIKGKI